ncbi:ABC transporter substrate-binding protein [Clostridia bacterium]|nr:ABC transporter substrate-binding protein [Clostridia bacterium]
MRKITIIRILAIICVAAFLSGCGKKKAEDVFTPAPAPTERAVVETPTPAPTPQIIYTPAPTETPAPILEEVISEKSGGHTVFGVFNAPFLTDLGYADSLNPLFRPNPSVLEWFSEDLLDIEGGFYTQNGVCGYYYDVQAKTFTLNMRHSPMWHNGTAVTLDDLAFAYEIICSPAYDGELWGDYMMNVSGAIAYKNGETNTISGLSLSEDKRSLAITFLEFPPSMLAGGIFTTPISRAYYAGVSREDMEDDDRAPLGFGPFYVSEVGGTYIRLSRYEDYWRGRANLDGVLLTVMKRTDAAFALSDGVIDSASFSAPDFAKFGDGENYGVLAAPGTTMNYTCFALGEFKGGQNVTDRAAKCADISLRKAIAYAVDDDYIAKNIYGGLFAKAVGAVPEAYAVHSKNAQSYGFEPETAKALLDAAGYLDVDGDGFREYGNGEKMTLYWALRESPEAYALAEYKIAAWAEIGLNVELYNGEPVAYELFYPQLLDGTLTPDFFDMSWDYGKNPNPNGIWGAYSKANFSHYTSEAFKGILSEISSEKAWSLEFLKERYAEFERVFFEEIPAFATVYPLNLTALSDRVTNYDAKNPKLYEIGILGVEEN